MITASDIRNVRRELVDAGLFERREAKTWGKLALLLGVAFTLIGLHTLLPLWATALLLPVTAFFFSAAAMIGHEGGHRSLSKSAFRCELLYHLVFPMLGGLGALQWKDKHSVVTTATPTSSASTTTWRSGRSPTRAPSTFAPARSAASCSATPRVGSGGR